MHVNELSGKLYVDMFICKHVYTEGGRKLFACAIDIFFFGDLVRIFSLVLAYYIH